jgi:hypothetical protein
VVDLELEVGDPGGRLVQAALAGEVGPDADDIGDRVRAVGPAHAAQHRHLDGLADLDVAVAGVGG